MISDNMAASRGRSGNGSRKDARRDDMLRLESLLRDVGRLAVDIGRLEAKKSKESADVHEIAERNSLAETHGDVEIHAPLKNTIVVIQTRYGSYQIDTHTMVTIVDKIGAEHFFRAQKIDPKLTHEKVINISPLMERVRRKDRQARDWLNQMIGNGIAEKSTVRRITPLGMKRAVKLRKGRLHG